MQIQLLHWTVGHAADRLIQPTEWYEATVPGAVQLDYANAKHLPPFYESVNFHEFDALENEFWRYRTSLDFSVSEGQTARLTFEGIDYRYEIYVDGDLLCKGEGMFSPVTLDVTRYAGTKVALEVLLHPSPKDPATPNGAGTRDEARKSCKSPACYGWDWHPRILTVGLWGAVTLNVTDECCLLSADCKYRLSEESDRCELTVSAQTGRDGTVEFSLLDPDGALCAQMKVRTCDRSAQTVLNLEKPRLWYPVGYGKQERYTLVTAVRNAAGEITEERREKIGFRRSRLCMNEGGWGSGTPISRGDSPITLQINGQKIFAKGSNWVNAQVFPGSMTREHFEQLLTLVRDANMNLLRIWGGGFVNPDSFFDLCDELGIMVWQEFPLACNEYPDDDDYLAVLEQEAVSILRRLRKHPCIVLWCGGNELFNGWGGMTDQHHALRLLDRLCYEEDRFTPFLMTSPSVGMAHGSYVNLIDWLTPPREMISVLQETSFTAYTEFGSPGLPSPEYLRRFATEEELRDCRKENPVWTEHHAFGAWREDSWLRNCELEYYFGGWNGLEDLCEKTAFLQGMGYRACFEEIRRHWPRCSMALNWCLNEPWPTFANNSIISWPAEPKEAYYEVQKALRPRLASLQVPKCRWLSGETFQAKVWMLNDTLEELPAGSITANCRIAETEQELGVIEVPAVAAQSNKRCGEISVPLPADFSGRFTVTLRVAGHPEFDSEYTYICKKPD